ALGGGAQPFIRFEHEAPNDLWQMDFKGHVALHGGRLHPLTVLDDHSRFSIALSACADQTTATVKARLIAAFRRYGLPWRIATDNGPPWGDGGRNNFTLLTVWLIEAGVAVSHSRPCHPQTLGKDERFHRSLKAEALQGPPFADLAKAQDAFDRWRHVYNTVRPHDALGGAVPLDRYRVSQRQYREIVERSTMPRTISSAAFSSMASSPSSATPCACAGPSPANPSPFAQPLPTASSTPGSDTRK
ncbi:integrase core domain-containing protein, partial [Mesorhizobium mediterraneum]|uniref:integrase core domain-containing protein n=1 Tax=Mesorhizobium mediterraneum TaxID=43617 RepID=UPI001784FFF9